MASIKERISKDGKAKSYRVQIRIKGSKPESATFSRKTDAKLWAAETESAIRNNRPFLRSKSNSRTVSEAIDRYLDDAAITKPKALRDLKSQLSWWRNEIGETLLSELSPKSIVRCSDKLMRGTTVRNKARSPATVLRYLATFSTLLSTVVKQWEWIDRSPMENVIKPRPGRGRVRFLSGEERTRLLDSCRKSSNPYLHTVVVLAISTGMRQGEVMKLTWEDVDLHVGDSEGKIILQDTKNGERRFVALSNLALDLLRLHGQTVVAAMNGPQKDSLTGLVFPSLKNTARAVPMDLRTPWETAVKNAGLIDFRFHDLRHTTASYLAMNGATLTEIAAVLGHKTLSMVKRYAHLSEQHTFSVVADMNSKIFASEMKR